MRSLATVCGGILLPLLASLALGVTAQYGTTAAPSATAALTSANAGSGGSGTGGSGTGANIACPAVTFAQRVEPIGGGLYRVVWTADKAADPTKALQSIASVDLHYRVNQAPMVNVRMPPTDASGKAFAVQTPLNSGDSLSYYMTYSAMISGNRIDCDTSLFSNTASTAALTAGPGMGAGFGPDPSNVFGVQPLQAPPNVQYGTAGPQALSGVPSSSQSNCPAITFSQAINRDALMGSAHTILFTALQPAAAGAATTGAQSQMQVMYVDVHFRINSGPEINVRLNPNPTDNKSWSLPGLNLMEGDTVSYYFTYCVLINGMRSDCDTSRLTFTRVTGGAGSSTTPLSTQPPSTAGIQLGGGAGPNSQPFVPQFPQFPQPLMSAPNPMAQPTAGSNPPTSGSGSGNGIGTPSSGGSAVCPAVTWQWQLMPATNAPDTFTLQFAAQSPVNPTLTLKNVASVDLHYVLNAAPVNVRMLQITPNAWASNIVITNANTAQLQFYFTYSAAFQSNTITCDTAQQTLTGASGAFNGGTASSQSSLPVSPSAVGAGASTGQTQPLMAAPQIINPFTQTGQAPSGFPPGTPQFAQGQVLPNDALNNPFSGATPRPPSSAPANPSGPPAPGSVPAGPGVTPQGFPSGLPSAGTCPAIDINHQVTQNADGSWTLTFFALQPRTPGAMLQSVDAVAVTAVANANPTVTRAMDRVNGLVWEWDIPTALKAGDTLKYAFNYTVMLNGMSVTCNTSQFAFAVSPSSATAAPAGQPMGATTPMQLAQLQQQLQQSSQFNPFRQPQPLLSGPGTGFSTGNPSQPLMPLGADPNQFQQQPMALGSAMGSAMAPMAPGTQSAADIARGTVSEVCPSISFTQKLEPNPSGGGVLVTFAGDKALKGSLQTLNFVDLHFRNSGSPDVNVRMTQSQTPLTWTYILPLNSVPAGATYYFTHCSTIGGSRVDCNTPLVTVASAIAGGQGAIVPQPLLAPTSPYGSVASSMQPLMQVGTPQTPQQMLLQSQTNGNVMPNAIQPLQAPQQPQQPQFQQPQALQQPALPSGYGQPAQPLLSPSGVLGQPNGATGSGGAGAGTGQPQPPAGAGAGNLPCPAIQWSYSMLPANSAGGAAGASSSASAPNSNTYRMVFTSGRALRPDATVSRLNYVDAHYTINGAAPVNVNMQSLAPASGSATAAVADGTTWVVDGLKLNPGDTIAWYHTYSATLGSSPVQCDTGVQTFVVPPQFGAQPPAPSTTAAGTNAAALLSGLPALGNALGIAPSGNGAGAGGGPGGAGQVVPASLVCPALLFDKQILPLGNNQYTLSFIANTAANPSAALQALNFVDAHYVVNNAQQINTHMVKKDGANPPTFTLPLTLQPGSTLAVYFTYSALLSSGTTAVQCDTAVFSFAN